MTNVTKPFLPPQADYEKYLDRIWDVNWLTNNGPLVRELESRLKTYLGVTGILYTGNGTIALQMAIKALGLKGKIITTPFSYVATTSSIVWENCQPIFVDIDHETLNINPALIEDSITEGVSGILATHCFGNACDIEKIANIASKHGLRVIYDAAHCFSSRYKGHSIFEYGDISTTSFHATKIFHTIEGGAIFAKDKELLSRIMYMRNFGHDGPERFNGMGINGKNSEFHAAMGLCVLSYIDGILERRKAQCLCYDEILHGLEVRKPEIQEGCDINYSYYPVIFRSEQQALAAKDALEKRDIFPRRYFFPPLSSLSYVDNTPTPIADDISRCILCLPLFHEMRREDQDLIARILLDAVPANV